MTSNLIDGAILENIKSNNVELTANVVASYVSHNPVSTSDLPTLISSVYSTIQSLESSGASANTPKENRKPAVPVKKSVTEDYIICLEDGKKFKSLKRHLSSHYNITPEQYREKWGLPHDYPMVAPNYAKRRSDLAKQIGLGRKAADGQSSKVA